MPSDDSGELDLIALLEALEGVTYVVVGGVAASLHGSPRVTFDLDIVPEDSEGNIARLANALMGIRASIREPGNRIVPITFDLLLASARSSFGGQLRMRTSSGPLDILWRLHDGTRFSDLAPHTVVFTDDERSMRVISIDDLIRIKSAAGRVQDRLDVQYLEIAKVRGEKGE